MQCRVTEADLRLFPTIARFDAVYAPLFKCGRRRVADYPHLSAWAADVQQIRIPGAGLQIQVGFKDLRQRSQRGFLCHCGVDVCLPVGGSSGLLLFTLLHGRHVALLPLPAA